MKLSERLKQDLPHHLRLVVEITECPEFKYNGLTLEQIRLLHAYYRIRETEPITYEKVFGPKDKP